MDKAQRLCEVLNLLNNGSPLGFPTSEAGTRYAMDEHGHIGQLTVENGRFTEKMIITDFSYNSWLNLCSHGYKELYDNVFSILDFSYRTPPALVITTNGDIDRNGCAVMGKGNALDFKKLFPGIEVKLASYLTKYGNRAFCLGDYRIQSEIDGDYVDIKILTCPTKHHWKDNSDITLISKSCEQLVEMCNKFKIETCFLPVPGCGNGGLNYNVTVKPVLELLLDERFYVCFRN